MNCARCNSPTRPAWDGSEVCPACTGVTRDFGRLCIYRPSPEVVAKVARLEAHATGLGWTLGELWNVRGWYPARGLVCFVRPDHRVRECTADRIILVRFDATGREVATVLHRNQLAAAVPVERLTARPQRAVA